MPPPPATALMSSGNPILTAARSASFPETTSEPGTPGTPASTAVARAAALSPIRRMASGGGPTKTRPRSAQRAAKPPFSARNPYPG